ncbi:MULTISPECIES: hypothetical protein [Kitasatospora]|uniref:Serine/threonine protein kinase n=1 Tax=Kitasatospora cystarginea TaxID=58350 RepID=A0ABN3E6X9_9ACTN
MITHETEESPERHQGQEPGGAAEFGDVVSSGLPEPEPAVNLDAGPDAGRRRPRTVTLLAGALLLGPLLGAGVGYSIQAARPETPLPSLHVAVESYPATPLDPTAAAEAEPKPLAIDGDLRKLLISKPDGADDWDNYGHGDGSGWLSVGAKAGSYGGADRQFRNLVHGGFRRDAMVAWTKGGNNYRVELIQFDEDHVSSAVDWAQGDTGSGTGIDGTLDGTVHGTYLARTQQDHFADSTTTYYFGSATARRGNVVMVVSIYSQSRVSADELKDIAEQQWKRLV